MGGISESHAKLPPPGGYLRGAVFRKDPVGIKSKRLLFSAFENLGFGQEYINVAQSVLNECKEQAARKLKRQNSRLEKCGIPEEELLRQQQELFDKVCKRSWTLSRSRIFNIAVR